MEAQSKVDTKDLENRIGELKKKLTFVNESSGSGETPDLFTIIHRPGWTTLVDVQIASQLLDAMNQQATAMGAMRDALHKHVQASRK